MAMGQGGPGFWELVIKGSHNLTPQKTQQELSNYLYKTQGIQNYYGRHNSGGSGVILGNLSSLAASHEPPLLWWWLPSRGFPNESPPHIQLKKIQPLHPDHAWDWIDIFTSLNFLQRPYYAHGIHIIPIDEDQLVFLPFAWGHQWEGGTQW